MAGEKIIKLPHDGELVHIGQYNMLGKSPVQFFTPIIDVIGLTTTPEVFKVKIATGGKYTGRYANDLEETEVEVYIKYNLGWMLFDMTTPQQAALPSTRV